MANQYVKTDSFRQGIVNKRSNPDYVNLSEKLTDFRAAAVSENQVTQWYIILNEHIYGSDESNFTSITYTSGEQTGELVRDTQYTINATSSIITFAENLNPREYTNLTANYQGDGSIIWAEDVTDLQKVLANIDTNAVYTDGSNPMVDDLYMGSGTSENPYHSIKNVDTVDNIKVSRHNHTGVQTSGLDAGKDYGAQIPTAGIENNAITEDKIRNSAVTNNKLNANSVTNGKIQGNTITADKFNSVAIGKGLTRVPETIDGVIVQNAVLQTNIDNSTITYNSSGVLQVPAIISLTGVVLPFAGSSSTIPAGWLLCDGTEYPKQQYPKLAQVIGNIYGGSTSTFKVPDFRNKTFWGGDASNVGTVKSAGIPNHYHGFGYNTNHNNGTFLSSYVSSGVLPTTSVTTKNSGGAINWNGSDSGHGRTSYSHTSYNANMFTSLVRQEVNTSTGGGVYSGSTSTVQPPAIQMMFIIKT